MSDIDKAITTGWYEIRTLLDTPDDLFDYLNLEKQDLQTVAEGLRLSVDEGVVEYKRSLLHSIMSQLGTLKYDSKAITDLQTQVKKSSYLTILPILQRLLILGIVKAPAAEEEEVRQEQEERVIEVPDLKTIIAEVRNMIKERPELQNNQDIKRIFLQLKYYNTELEKKNSLEPNIPKEKKASFEANFKERFDEIHGKIQNAYRSFLSQEEKKSRPESKLPILRRYDFTKCENIYRKQAEEASKLYHTLTFAQKERYQMREILLQMASAEPYYEDSYKKEIECYRRTAPFSGDDIRVSLALAEKLRRYCERSVEWRPR
ncbi:MAG: hypothetical protein ACLFQW_08335 [Spirochaetaceae bacterium]